MRFVAAGILVLFCLASARAQEAPAPAAEPSRALGGLAICDLLLSSSAALRDRGMAALNNLSDARAEEVGNAILSRPVLEARRLIALVGRSTGASAVVAAIVCLDSKEAELRNRALDAMMDVPLAALRKAGDHHLKESRRNTLRAMLMDKDSLQPFCEGLPEVDGLPRAPVERTLRLAILVDRYYGAAGFVGLLRTLGEMMIGEEDGKEEPEPAKEEAEEKDGDKQPAEEAEPGKDGEKGEVDQAAELRAHSQRLRRQAAVLFETIWMVAPGAQFNYVVNAPIAERRKAVARINTVLTEMESREFTLGPGKLKGVRFGDYLLGFSDARLGQFGQEVLEIVMASYMRLRWWKGEEVPLEGEGYSEAVSKLNELGRRGRADLRRDIQRWWESYRADTDRK